ncbi:recombinase family protein [Streptomyces sp. NPDC005336]|uniref:recombinase family protein n=1 Tax=Streptomyces sp. NPDC005336 TaxID=3157035 RepID=UPI0033A3ACA3
MGTGATPQADPVGRPLLNMVGIEADLIRMRTREGMAVARAKGRLRGKQPKLSTSQRKHLLALHEAGAHTQAELAELYSVSRTTIYREVQRQANSIVG